MLCGVSVDRRFSRRKKNPRAQEESPADCNYPPYYKHTSGKVLRVVFVFLRVFDDFVDRGSEEDERCTRGLAFYILFWE